MIKSRNSRSQRGKRYQLHPRQILVDERVRLLSRLGRKSKKVRRWGKLRKAVQCKKVQNSADAVAHAELSLVSCFAVRV